MVLCILPPRTWTQIASSSFLRACMQMPFPDVDSNCVLVVFARFQHARKPPPRRGLKLRPRCALPARTDTTPRRGLKLRPRRFCALPARTDASPQRTTPGQPEFAPRPQLLLLHSDFDVKANCFNVGQTRRLLFSEGQRPNAKAPTMSGDLLCTRFWAHWNPKKHRRHGPMQKRAKCRETWGVPVFGYTGIPRDTEDQWPNAKTPTVSGDLPCARFGFFGVHWNPKRHRRPMAQCKSTHNVGRFAVYPFLGTLESQETQKANGPM